MLRRALAIWFAILLLAFVNGAFREALLVPRFGALFGGQISVVLLSAAVLLTTCAAIRWMDPASADDALTIGALWVSLTVAFEFLAGHFLFGKSWDDLLADYHVEQGRLWIVVLVVTMFAPLVCRKTGATRETVRNS